MAEFNNDTMFELKITEDWVNKEIDALFIYRLEHEIGRKVDESEYASVCQSITKEIGAKPRGINHRDGVSTRFIEWFADVMPNSFELLQNRLRNALDHFIWQEIKDMYREEIENG